mmetsp:Transcript_79743/g.237535  ORF Transcript_79743/g.237535 Transcript_79743/m.237535 type:complete len:200 (-) Transcript_79743:85-684(-)
MHTFPLLPQDLDRLPPSGLHALIAGRQLGTQPPKRLAALLKNSAAQVAHCGRTLKSVAMQEFSALCFRAPGESFAGVHPFSIEAASACGPMLADWAASPTICLSRAWMSSAVHCCVMLESRAGPSSARPNSLSALLSNCMAPRKPAKTPARPASSMSESTMVLSRPRWMSVTSSVSARAPATASPVATAFRMQWTMLVG